MNNRDKKSVRFRGKTEEVLESLHVRGRTYLVLEKLSWRGAYRVFDRHAGPDGDYRALYRIPKAKVSKNQIEILRRIGGTNANRNFPAIVDFAYQGNEVFIVMSWVPGVSLQRFLDSIRRGETPRPSAPECVRLVRGLVHGLSHFHKRTNIIHGDVAPSNIILTAGSKHLVLIDYGSALPLQQASIGDGDGSTPPYAAPEQLTPNASIDFRSDIFSLTVIAYELLTLSIPFEGLGGRAGLPEIAGTVKLSCKPSEKIQASDRLPARSLRLLDDGLIAGLKLDPEQRFATSSEWMAAWDSLFLSLKKQTRLSSFEELLVSKITSIARFFTSRNN